MYSILCCFQKSLQTTHAPYYMLKEYCRIYVPVLSTEYCNTAVPVNNANVQKREAILAQTLTVEVNEL